VWSQAGGSFRLEPAGVWWAARSEPPADEEAREWLAKQWIEPHGDRRQQLVMIGVDMDSKSQRLGLELCLLSDEELAEGASAWAAYEDPFPAWHIEGMQHIASDRRD
jgi:hypothetical protein